MSAYPALCRYGHNLNEHTVSIRRTASGNSTYVCKTCRKLRRSQRALSARESLIATTAANLADTDEWRPVIGYEGAYEVSRSGLIRRIWSQFGAYRLLRPTIDKRGYCRMKLSVHGTAQTIKVHRVVAAAFIGPCPPGHHVNHIDGCKQNNNVGNLEYASPDENWRHAVSTGLAGLGERHHQAKANDATVAAVRRDYVPGSVGYRVLAERYHQPQSTVRAWLKGWSRSGVDVTIEEVQP